MGTGKFPLLLESKGWRHVNSRRARRANFRQGQARRAIGHTPPRLDAIQYHDDNPAKARASLASYLATV